ncbi:hypothetical protein D3C87_465750 [compost metagenome]
MTNNPLAGAAAPPGPPAGKCPMKCITRLSILMWQATDTSTAGVPDVYQDTLSEYVEEQVFLMILHGYTCGKLSETMTLGIEGEPEKGLTFEGVWSITWEIEPGHLCGGGAIDHPLLPAGAAMQENIEIKFEWWHNDDLKMPASEEYHLALRKHAYHEILPAIAQGSLDGSLEATVRLNIKGEPRSGVAFQGYWVATIT